MLKLFSKGTNLVSGIDHLMHLHGFSFFVVEYGFGNLDKNQDSEYFNLVDPPLLNIVIVPKSGWTAIWFQANNPGTITHLKNTKHSNLDPLNLDFSEVLCN